MDVYVYISMCVHAEREREGERERHGGREVTRGR